MSSKDLQTARGAKGSRLDDERIHGVGEMPSLVRRHSWEQTSLGPIDVWSETLLCSVNLVLTNRFPAALFWGPQMIQIYNDAYLPVLAEKHPWALGQPASECWKEAWHIVGAQLEATLFRGQSTYQENVLIPINRRGALQDAYWTYSSSPVYGPAGEICGILTICHDVTEEVFAKRERDTLAEQLRQVLEATTDAIVSIDRDWRMTYLNPRAREIVAPSGDVVGRNMWETFPHLTYENSPFEKYYRRAMDEGIEGEFESYYPEPLNIWVHVHARPTKDGIVVFFRDITAQKRTETAARESAARLEAIYNTSLEYIGLLSTDGKVLDCNRASLEFVGNTREQVVGLNFWETPWFIYTPGAPEMLRHAIARAASGEHVRYQVTLMRPVGDPITFDFSLSPVRNARAEVVFLVPEGRDITFVKRTEAALKESEKLADVGRLAASIAHEINNPLESVSNLLYLAINTANRDELNRYLHIAERELGRVSAITNQTLRFYRQSTNPRAVPCEDLIDSVLAIHHRRILGSRVRMHSRLRATQPLNCFEGEIRQVLNNLIGNAIDAMQAGGDLFIRSREGTHWPTRRRGLVMTVADTGTGIRQENLRKIFEPFFSTKGIGGTGLGLWVSHEIVQRHQGVLRVRSAQRPDRHGTVFTLFLPFEGVSRASAA